MVTFYRIGKGTVVNYFGIDKVTTFRNGDIAVTSGNVTALSPCPGKFDFKDAEPIIKTHRQGTRVTSKYLAGYNPGMNSVPLHPPKELKMWNYWFGTTATASASYETHVLTEADTLYFWALHTEMEHTSYAVRNCLLGNYLLNYHFEWSDTDACMHAWTFKTATSIAGNDITRLTTIDYGDVYAAGCNSHTLTYNSDSVGITNYGGSFDVDFKWVETKDGEYVSDAKMLSRDYTINLDCRIYNSVLIGLADDPNNYSGAVTYQGQWWKSGSKTTDNAVISASNMQIGKVHSQNIGETEGFWRGMITLTNTGTIEGSWGGTIIDALGASHYESA